MVSLVDFLRHEEETGHGHENPTDGHGYPPEGTDVFRVPEKGGYGGTAATGEVELELGEDSHGGKEMNTDERVDEAGAAETLAEFLHGHGTEAFGQV